MITTSEYLVHILPAQVSHMSELRACFLIIQTPICLSDIYMITVSHGCHSHTKISLLCLIKPRNGSSQLL